MSNIVFRQSAVDKLTSDPEIQRWWQCKSNGRVPFLWYYWRSYSTSRESVVTEHGDGFMLTTIDPHDHDETKDIVIRSVSVGGDFDILVGGEEAIMAGTFAIGWSKTFT